MHHIAFHRIAPRHTNHIASHDKTSNHIELGAHIALGYKTRPTKQHSNQATQHTIFGYRAVSDSNKATIQNHQMWWALRKASS